MNACEDFFIVIVVCHVLCAAMKMLDMDTLDSFPDGIESEWVFETQEERRQKLHSIALEVVTTFTDFSVFQSELEPNGVDYVCEYAKEVLTHGLLYMEYQDAIREGDGERVLECWKYFMMIFKATNHRNYAVEAFNLLAQVQWFLADRQVMQVKYSRFINLHGRPGCNVSCDLVMERLNRVAKTCVTHLGANKTPSSIQRIGKSIGGINEILSCFDKENKISTTSSHHSIPSYKTNRDTIIKELSDCNVFSNRTYQHCTKFTCNVMKDVNRERLDEWMKMQFEKILNSFV